MEATELDQYWINKPANLENSAVVTGLGKVSFHSNTKERKCQRMFKQSQNCTHFKCQQDYAQNPSSQASPVHDLRTCMDLEKAEEPKIKLPTSTGSQKKQGIQKNIYFCIIYQVKALVWIMTNWKILQEMGIPDYLTCLLRNLYAAQEATVRTRHRTTDWFKIEKRVCQGCILLPCLFNLHVEYII